MSILEPLNEIFCEVFDDDDIELSPELTADGVDGWETIWKPAEVRNDTEVINNANSIADRISQRTYFEMIAPVVGWKEEDIERELERKRKETESQNGTGLPPAITANSFAGTLSNSGDGVSPLAAAAAATEG